MTRPLDSKEKYSAPIFARNFVSINTLSPNGKFYYRFKDPKELYWGLFCCAFAFYSDDNELIYHNKGQLAQCGLSNKDDWEFIYYSASGDLAYLIERNSPRTLNHVVIDLGRRKVFRETYTDKDRSEHITELLAHPGFSDSAALALAADRFTENPVDKMRPELPRWLLRSSWRP